eukprot:c6881_g1_i1.p1 GENE.c6881_g1_i1~~c6881_g1_i1.p1  ORF type:complete len:421 (+),score=109.03 c6881_g1_i1:54-1316(+)
MGKHNQFEYEFGGPFGALSTMIALPIVIVALNQFCDKNYCLDKNNISELQNRIPNWNDLFDANALGVVLAWLAFHVFLERVLPHTKAQGVELANKTRLSYRINAHAQFWVTIVVVASLHAFTQYKLDYVYEHFLHLAVASVIVSISLSTFLYVKSFTRGALLAKGGNSGNPIYDFFIGRELNPRIGDFDLKVFCELRPGLIGWFVINAAMAVHEYSRTGFISMSMLLVNVSQGLYVWDALFNEVAILTTMDITTDGFGYMLAFGDLSWVPFTYSLQARYLADYNSGLSPAALATISSINLIGLYIFRGANGQKDAFRSNPNAPAVRHLKFLETKSGRKLLTSGFWGLARKINYTGDWLMGLSWCLFCGSAHITPYFYAIYFAVLLIHRALRDDHSCSLKYGEDWNRYKKIVRYMFVPGVI